MALRLLIVAVATLVINLPLGYWRRSVRKFSPPWFVAVHAAVPLVILMRYVADLGFAWYTYPPLILCYFSGQFLGAWYRHRHSAPKQNDADVASDSVVL